MKKKHMEDTENKGRIIEKDKEKEKIKNSKRVHCQGLVLLCQRVRMLLFFRVHFLFRLKVSQRKG